MRQIKGYKWLAAALLGVAFAACYDKDNTIHRLPDMVLSNFGTGEVHTGEMIDINPVCTMNGEEVECSYVWYRYHGSVPEVISEERHLQYRVDTTSSITLGVEATHLETGMMVAQTFVYTIVPRINRGWIILKETSDGNTDMDGYLLQSDETVEFAENILSTALGAPMAGRPVSVWSTPAYTWYNRETGATESDQNCLVPVSEKEILMYRITDERVLSRTGDLFYEAPDSATRVFEAASILGGNATLIANGKAHLMQSDGTAFLPALNGDYRLAPWLVANENVTTSVVFDESTHSFALVAPSSRWALTMELEYLPDTYRDADDLRISSNNMDADLLFLGHTVRSVDPESSYSSSMYALMREAGNSESVMLYGLNGREVSLTSGRMGFIRFAREIPVSRCPAFAEADFYTMHEENNVIYFVSGNQLSYYDIDTDTFHEDVYSFSGEVSYCKFLQQGYDRDPWGMVPYDYSFTYLVVATQSGGRYTIHVFDVEGNNVVLRPDDTMEGEGTVRSLFWYSPNLAQDFYGDLYIYS